LSENLINDIFNSFDWDFSDEKISFKEFLLIYEIVSKQKVESIHELTKKETEAKDS
jgi:Ca2+-binding EF-hand superfamily protein